MILWKKQISADEELIGNDTIQQTLVYLTEGHSETETEQDQILQKLQNERMWKIIVRCYRLYCPSHMWMPPHRLLYSFRTFLAAPEEVRNILMKNLLDVIKDPDFDLRPLRIHAPILSCKR